MVLTIHASVIPWLITAVCFGWALLTPEQGSYDFSMLFRLPMAGFIAAVPLAVYFAVI
jgi:hypothetical protein